MFSVNACSSLVFPKPLNWSKFWLSTDPFCARAVNKWETPPFTYLRRRFFFNCKHLNWTKHRLSCTWIHVSQLGMWTLIKINPQSCFILRQNLCVPATLYLFSTLQQKKKKGSQTASQKLIQSKCVNVKLIAFQCVKHQQVWRIVWNRQSYKTKSWIILFPPHF